jgi:serine/threonine protein kinase
MENTFGKYRIAAPLATKSSNPAYRARSVTATEWNCVVKVYNDQKLQSLQAQGAWRHSMASFMHLQHPHILPIIETGIEGDVPYSVTKYMEQGSLRDRLNRIFPEQLVVQETRKIIVQVGQALQYAHDQQILHGNIKPENILFDEHDNVLLGDFCGPFCEFLDPDETEHSLPAAEHLLAESEVAADDSSELQFTYHPALESLSEKSDQYALGCLAYELLTGRLQTAMLSSTPLSMQPLPKKTPTMAAPTDQEWVRQIETVLRRAVADEPQERYENIAAFLEAFELACNLSDETEVSAIQSVPVTVPALSTPPEIRSVARLMQTGKFAWQRQARISPWWCSALLMRVYQACREKPLWRWSAIMAPLVLLLTFCVLLISHFTSSQHTWQAVGPSATPTLQAANGTAVSATPQSIGFARQQQTPTFTAVITINATPPASARSVPTPLPSQVASAPTPTQVTSSSSHKASSSRSSSSSHESSSGDSSSGSTTQPVPTPIPTPVPTPPPVPTPTPTPVPTNACRVSYSETNWNFSGFVATITITNTGGTTINQWRLQWTFSGNERIMQAWGAQVTQYGQFVMLTNMSWNGTIAPGSSIKVGFSGSFFGSINDPSSFALNGVPCQ